MKRIFPLAFPFLLAGCPSIGDRIPVDYPATANLREGKVCITVQSQGDEKLAGISIYQLDETQNRTFKFFEPLRAIAPNQCVPDEGYVFTPGQQYHFSAKLVSLNKQQAGEFPSAREFVAEFAVRQEGNQLRLEVLRPPR
ncbi:putative T6SS immunity periplasmic lipoprotein [Serratia sp. CY47444]|uniref:putative T6SS immunity periplasmic lipoprotein n=1 Tax=Serratia sp. CY47444 TaxID=3383626 RepID=UPI003FA155D5